MTEKANIVGAIIAGGEARRMGGRIKPAIPLGGQPLVEHLIGRLAPQVGALVLSVADASSGVPSSGLPVVKDTRSGRQGPLAGIEAALIWARANAPEAEWLAVVPCDVPFLPKDLVARLIAAAERENVPSACAEAGGQLQSLCAVLRPAVLGALQDWLAQERRAVHSFWEQIGSARVLFDGADAEAFLNINTPADLRAAEERLKAKT